MIIAAQHGVLHNMTACHPWHDVILGLTCPGMMSSLARRDVILGMTWMSPLACHDVIPGMTQSEAPIQSQRLHQH